ncbi:ATP-binding protein [Eubacterium ramulus]|uniref:ATP-binding protein n=1 Tax=Eubacterium ramulus TaxID=39490 RepID=UPI0022E5C05A|nr:ATP-binding protein [Eubacterium ramulus]
MPAKKESGITRKVIGVLTVLLVIFILIMMRLVSGIQGTARVVNYAGLVRGGTQRWIKMEITGNPRDKMMEAVESYIDGLQNGSEDLGLVRLKDAKYQAKVEEQKEYFQKLKEEVQHVRESGYDNTNIIEDSETFFQICDDATGLAEAYSQRKASQLDILEKVVTVDILALIFLTALELVRALRYAAMNRELQKKVYLDEATGIPNKNKCEELLSAAEPVTEKVALCVFDLNNLRVINNSLGHEKGDAYIRNFAQLLYEIVPKEYFVGRNGGDEFIVLFYDMDHLEVQEQLKRIEEHVAVYSATRAEMPISYAVGYALSTDWEGSTMRMLFDRADRNMYIHKNHMKLEESRAEKQMDRQLLRKLRFPGHKFSECMYCDAKRDMYRMIRKSEDFILASEGNYSGAVEQLTLELAEYKDQDTILQQLRVEALAKNLTSERPTREFQIQFRDKSEAVYGRIFVLFVDADETGALHHFLLAFEKVHNAVNDMADARFQLQQYYEQMKQSVLEDENYVDALLGNADIIYSVNLTEDVLEQNFFKPGESNKLEDLSDLGMELPCSYDAYCQKYCERLSQETRAAYRMIDTSDKLLKRFENGENQVVIEYREKGSDDNYYWIQKTVLMSENRIYDVVSDSEVDAVHGIVLLRNVTELHAQEQKEMEDLRVAYEEAEAANQAKTAFLSRMSHDIRTPINGVMGMLEMIRHNREDQAKVDECLEKINVSAEHLLLLINDVLDMSKLEAGYIELEHVPFVLDDVLHVVSTLVETQIEQMNIVCQSVRGPMEHTRLLGSPIHFRQILLNLFSNAVKYNKPGGRINIYSEELSNEGKAAWFLFKISDTGVGMSKEFVETQLFEPFTQEKNDARTQYRGTGLGMAIVKELIEEMGGTISVESTVNVGSTFTVKIPFEIDQTEVQDEMPKLDLSKKLLSGTRILLAEDNELNMEIAEFMLTEQGAKVCKAWNGKEALDDFASSEPGSVDLILMDIMMPVMDGLEAARRIRELDRTDAQTVPIVAMTANAFFDDIEMSKKAGMNEHLSKPLKMESLVETIYKLRHSNTKDQ